MFLRAVAAGFGTLANWQVWVGAVVSSCLLLAYQLAHYSFLEKVGKSEGALGCLTLVLGGSVVQAALTAVYLTWVLPLAVGLSTTTPGHFLVEHFWRIVFVGVLGFVAAMAFALLPIVGRSATAGAFVSGVAICRAMADADLDALADQRHLTLHYPGFWASGWFRLQSLRSMGQLVIWGLSLAFAAAYRGRHQPEPPAYFAPIIQSAAMVTGLLAVFMYMQYVALSFRT